jgi:hypothetical protein
MQEWNTGTLFKARLFGKVSDIKFGRRQVMEEDVGGEERAAAILKGNCRPRHNMRRGS